MFSQNARNIFIKAMQICDRFSISELFLNYIWAQFLTVVRYEARVRCFFLDVTVSLERRNVANKVSPDLLACSNAFAYPSSQYVRQVFCLAPRTDRPSQGEKTVWEECRQQTFSTSGVVFFSCEILSSCAFCCERSCAFFRCQCASSIRLCMTDFLSSSRPTWNALHTDSIYRWIWSQIMLHYVRHRWLL